MSHDAIRPMTIADYPAALALWRRCDGVTVRTGADSEPQIARFLAHNPGLSLVALASDALIATLLVGSDGRRGYIHHAAVAPEHRRHGLGRALVEAALAALRAEGIAKCHLMLLPDNQAGLAFWRKLGWQRRDDILILSRNLTDDPDA